MKVNLIFTILVFSLNLLSAQNFTSDYIALTTPHQYDDAFYYLNDNKKIEIRNIREVMHDTSLLNSFTNIVSNVTVYKINEKGELNLAKIGISRKNETCQVIYDFSQTQTITAQESENIESLLVGVGVRMVAKVKTKKKGINSTSLFGLTANLNKIEGSLEVRVSGIGSKRINDIIPTTADLSSSSISTALQAVATIKSHIYYEGTIITPQILAYSKADKKVKQIQYIRR